ncbi:hypothetical protein NLI96_g1272 [Meripilus lineatus]|uniref:Uncharacterized protein n=1 Tax=Meripilus lineatus TaxID=2056292 RepID=A0AAD5VAI0_9APHY|nr:hypothetical protein NLI96_g1272 [Physisporinus lineatus]
MMQTSLFKHLRNFWERKQHPPGDEAHEGQPKHDNEQRHELDQTGRADVCVGEFGEDSGTPDESPALIDLGVAGVMFIARWQYVVASTSTQVAGYESWIVQGIILKRIAHVEAYGLTMFG